MNNFKYSTLDDVNNENTEPLYSEIQRVYLKYGIKEERQRDLRLTLKYTTGLSPVCQKNISLQLTDDDDPFFLFALVITEDDFKTIKCQQSLLVDFDHFPSQFVKLLEQCKSDVNAQGPRFLLLLESKEEGDISRSTYLKIVETNLFKNLCHLDLKISNGSDTDIKKMMALQIKKLKEGVFLSNKELAQTSSRLTDCLQRLELKRLEGEKLREQWEDEKRSIINSTNALVSEEKQRLLSAKLNWQTAESKRKQEAELKLEGVIKNLEAQIVQLSSQNHMLFEKNCQGESTKRERSGQVEVLEKELATSQVEIASLKKQNSKLDADYHEKNRLVNSLKTKLAVVEQELKDTTILHSKQLELLRNANEQKAHLEEAYHEKDNTLQRKQASLKNLSDELMKANEIITKLQAELVAVKSKLKLRTNIALEQERLLSTKQQELTTTENKLMQIRHKLEEFAESERKLNESLAAANEKIEAQEKQIRNDDNVIQWLNRQLASSHSESRPVYPNLSSTAAFMSNSRQAVANASQTGASQTGAWEGATRLGGSKLSADAVPTTLQLAPAIISAASNRKQPVQVRLPMNIASASAENTGIAAAAKRIIPSAAISSAYFPRLGNGAN